MSARDEAIEAVARAMCDHAYKWGDRLHGWDDSGADVRETFREGARDVLDAAHASGAIVYADELELMGWLPPDEIRPQHPEATTWTPVYSVAMGEGWVPVFRKRPQEPNE